MSSDSYDTDELLASVAHATKLSNALPSGDDFEYYNSYPEFQSQMDQVASRLIGFADRLMEYGVNGPHPTFSQISDPDDVAANFGDVVDVVDSFMEVVHAYVGEAEGGGGRSTSAVGVQTQSQQILLGDKGEQVFFSANIPRPQLNFKDEIDNSHAPFVPKITRKPNAVMPLDPNLQAYQERVRASSDLKRHLKGARDIRPMSQDEYRSWLNPYEYEIDNFIYVPTQLTNKTEQPYLPLDKTRCTWVSTVDQLIDLSAKLDSQQEFAVDLEQHFYRSYQGFVCLMQISTRTEDFLIDALELRSELQLLNNSFTNPNIVKVFHGSNSDIEWLQRDFGIYVVNLFDTGQAARVLEFPNFSLSYLLSTYCRVVADKRHQLSDWRIRPLPDDMFKYAQQDTHYLLYIADVLQNQLIAKSPHGNNLLLEVLRRGREICRKTYEKEIIDDNSYMQLYQNLKAGLNAVQLRVFRSVFTWRDQIARDEDESVRYVLPNSMLLKIATETPSTMSDLYQCCSPVVPPLIKQHAADLVVLLQHTRSDTTGITRPKSIASLSAPSSIGGHQRTASPAPTAEQLYLQAGWVESTPTPAVGPNPFVSMRPAEFSPVSQGGAVLFGSSLFRGFGEETDPEAKKRVEKIKAQLEKSFFGGFSGPVESNAEDEDEVGGSASGSGDKPAAGGDGGGDEATAESIKEIPRSMAEIYKLSNQNRKRNKDKKKLKDDSGSAAGGGSSTSGLDDESKDDVSSGADEASESQQPNKPPASGAKAEDTNEFMRKIGWLDDSELPARSGLSASRSMDQRRSKESTFDPASGSGDKKKIHKSRDGPKPFSRYPATYPPPAKGVPRSEPAEFTPYEYPPPGSFVLPTAGELPTGGYYSGAVPQGPRGQRPKTSSRPKPPPAAGRTQTYRSSATSTGPQASRGPPSMPAATSGNSAQQSRTVRTTRS